MSTGKPSLPLASPPSRPTTVAAPVPDKLTPLVTTTPLTLGSLPTSPTSPIGPTSLKPTVPSAVLSTDKTKAPKSTPSAPKSPPPSLPKSPPPAIPKSSPPSLPQSFAPLEPVTKVNAPPKGPITVPSSTPPLKPTSKTDAPPKSPITAPSTAPPPRPTSQVDTPPKTSTIEPIKAPQSQATSTTDETPKSPSTAPKKAPPPTPPTPASKPSTTPTGPTVGSSTVVPTSVPVTQPLRKEVASTLTSPRAALPEPSTPLEPSTPSHTAASTSTATSGITTSTSTTPLGTLSEPLSTKPWYNSCLRCNGTQTAPHTCCIVCRNYDEIDKVAMSITRNTAIAKESESPSSIIDRLTPLNRAIFAAYAAVKEAQRVVESEKSNYNKEYAKWQELYKDTLSAAKPRKEAEEAYEKAYNALTATKPKEPETSKVAAATTGSSRVPGSTPGPSKQPEKSSEAGEKEKEEEVTKESVAKKLALREEAYKTYDNIIAASTAGEKRAKACEAKVDEAKRAVDRCNGELKKAVEKAEAMVRVIAQILLIKAGLVRSDQISRARFFFMWIAGVLTYDKQARDFEQRNPCNTLVEGREVCQGFADLFQLMFNTDGLTGLQVAQPMRSCVIAGYSRHGVGDQRDDKELRHAWNAFPIPGVGDSPPTMKVIDCTWGGGNGGDIASNSFIDPIWFTRENSDFLIDHLPDKEKESFTTKTVSKDEFWQNDYAEYSSCSQGFFISRGSVSPPQLQISWSKQTFSYKRMCGHVLEERMPTFALLVSPPGKLKPIAAEDLIWFTQKETGGELYWEAVVDLSKKPYGDSKVVRLLAMFELGKEPRTDSIQDFSSIKGNLSNFIYGTPYRATSYDELSKKQLKGHDPYYVTAVRWNKVGFEEKREA